MFSGTFLEDPEAGMADGDDVSVDDVVGVLVEQVVNDLLTISRNMWH